VPSVVVSIAENQRHTCEALSRAGAILYLGHAGQVGRAEIAAALRRCTSEPQSLLALSAAARPLVDGLGLARIADALLSKPNSLPKDPR
jgi:spore coat polysaccharide biosynthesis predicted glycosyltransferase SpsG